jgi:hypothetical protein
MSTSPHTAQVTICGDGGYLTIKANRSKMKNGRRWPAVIKVCLLFLCPFLAPFDAIPLVLGGRVKGEFVQLFTGEAVALSAMILALPLAAILDGALRTPKRLFNGKASCALHNLAPFAFAAQ